MAVTTLGSKALMSIVKVKENGVLQDFYVVRHNAYTSGCTLLLRRYTYSDRQWHDEKVNAYATSTIDAWLNSNYFNGFPADIRGKIANVTIPYTPGNGIKTLSSLSRKVFALSATELGASDNNLNVEGTPLSNAETLRYDCTDNGGTGKIQWTRSPCRNITDAVYGTVKGGANVYVSTYINAVRPAFTLPASIWVHDDGTVAANLPPTTPSSITVPITLKGGDSYTVSWGAATDPDGNLSGYRLERSVNGGAWTEVYSGAALSSVQTITKGWNTVAFRVRAVDTPGEFSGYATSPTRTVINNNPPTTPNGISVPTTCYSSKNIDISWGASTDPDGDAITYLLERSVNGGSYTQVSSTAGLSFTEAVSTSWNTLQYRVKARDSYGDESAYMTSATCAVIHNQPPVISGQNDDLGTQVQPFGYDYTVTDPDGDAVTSTEAVDGMTIRSFNVTLGETNTAHVDKKNFTRLALGDHTLLITARDSAGNVVDRNMSFRKWVDGFSIALTSPLDATTRPARVNLVVHREIPAGALFVVEVCNNPFDAEPIWEDATQAVLRSTAHVFENKTQSAIRAGLNIRVNVGRNGAIGDCWVSGIGGNFE